MVLNYSRRIKMFYKCKRFLKFIVGLIIWAFLQLSMYMHRFWRLLLKMLMVVVLRIGEMGKGGKETWFFTFKTHQVCVINKEYYMKRYSLQIELHYLLHQWHRHNIFSYLFPPHRLFFPYLTYENIHYKKKNRMI